MAYLPLNSVRNITNATAKLGGLAFDGVTVAADTHAIADILTSDFSFSGTFLVPVSLSGNAVIIALTSSATAAASNYSFLVYLQSNGSLTAQLNGASFSLDQALLNVTGVIAAYGGKVISYMFTRSGTTTAAYINGVAQTLTTTGSTGSAPAWSGSVSSSYATIGRYAGGSLFNSTIYSATIFNRALSASEVVTLANQGVAESDKWGSLTAARTYDWSAGVDGWVANDPAVTTVARDAGPTVGVSNNLSVTDTGVAGNHLARSADSPLVIGKKYRLTYSYYWPVANSANYSSFRVWYRDASATIESVSPIKDGAWHTRTVDFTATSAVGPAFYIYNASNTFNFTGTVGDVAYFNAISLTKIGSILDADLSAGVGYQVPDRSSNNYRGLISTSGTTWALPRKTGQAIFTASSTGYLGDATNRTVIPDGARIDNIQAYSASGSTFSLGDDSTVPTNVIGSTTISAATLTDLGTPAKRFLTTGTDGRLYVTFSAANSTVFTINYSV